MLHHVCLLKRACVFAVLLATAGMLFFTSCQKDKLECYEVSTKAKTNETDYLRSILKGRNIEVTEDPRGFFYVINQEGDANKANVCSTVTVNYVGTFLTGIEFDRGNKVSFALANLILGWQEGIPLVGAGGIITLYLPPSLAYGSQASGSVPANSNLVFKIEVIAVN